ncbi:nucleotide exchange factor GrpE [soil metagenome]
MMDERRDRGPIRVKVMDKRRTARAQQGAAEVEPQAAPAPEDRSGLLDPETDVVEADEMAKIGEAQGAQDFLEDLRRLQAEFDNYRKRVLREQTVMATRASARLIERLLPVLDNFERALDHGEGGPGIELVIKELRATLEAEGLEEMQAEGEPFDPRLHEAFQAVDDPEVTEPVVRTVYRRGYKLGDAVLRAPMVVVARPVETPEPEEPASEPAES